MQRSATPCKIYTSAIRASCTSLTRRGTCSLPSVITTLLASCLSSSVHYVPCRWIERAKRKLLYLPTCILELLTLNGRGKIILNKIKPQSYLTLDSLCWGVVAPFQWEYVFQLAESLRLPVFWLLFFLYTSCHTHLKVPAMVLSNCFWVYKLMQHRWRGIWQYRANQMWMHISFDQAICFQKIYFYTHIFAKGPKNKVIHWSIVRKVKDWKQSTHRMGTG